MHERKLKVSLTLSRDIIERVDRDVGRGETRSSAIERWLRRAARHQAEREIEAATAAYYDALGEREKVDEEALSRALSRASRKVHFDERSVRRRRRGR